MKPTDPNVLVIKVSGVTYDNRQERIAQLSKIDPVRLEPEPENKFDPNAIAVIVMHKGQRFHCGYVPRELAARIAPLLEGESLMVKIKAVTGGFNTLDGERAAFGLKLTVTLPHAQLL